MTARNKPSKYCKGAIACDYLCGDTMPTIRANYGIASYMTIERALESIDKSRRSERPKKQRADKHQKPQGDKTVKERTGHKKAARKYCYAAIVCHWLCGDSRDTIKMLLGCGSSAVGRAIANADKSARAAVKRTVKRISKTAQRDKEIADAYATGEYTKRQLSDTFGVSYDVVDRATHEYGVDGTAVMLAYNAKQKQETAERWHGKKPNGKSRRRARKWTDRTGADYDAAVNLRKLYDRDGGICALCGKPTDWTDIYDDHVGGLYPSIDHIRPLSKGGAHTWENVQLAHCYCNSIKSDAC